MKTETLNLLGWRNAGCIVLRGYACRQPCERISDPQMVALPLFVASLLFVAVIALANSVAVTRRLEAVRV